jgi:hypothetical protein
MKGNGKRLKKSKMTIFVEKNHWFEDLNVIIFTVV